jgi:outer membrane receptor for ferric coprogen and ferric-rhodotorulic acid
MFILAALLGIFGSGVAHAQNTAPQAASSSASSGETLLPEITVQAEAEKNAVTENSASYTTPQMSTATRLPLSIRETPQSVTVITRQRMDDQAVATLTDVLRYTPGISVNGSDGSNRPTFFARGFGIDNVMYDGQPAYYQGWTVSPVPNMAMYDRVEVVRGATGLVTGSGNPSAAINVVRKRPTADPRLSFTARASRWDNYQGETDISGPLNAAGTLRARAVVAYQDGGTFRDGEKLRHGLFYAVAEADLGERTTVTLGASYQNDYTNHFWGGLPITPDGRHMGLPRSTNPSNDWERKDQPLTTVFGEWKHRFANGWQARLSASQSQQDAVFLGTYLDRGTSDGSLGHYAWRGDYDEKQSNYDLFANGPFQLLGRKHELAFGASRRAFDSTAQDYSGSGFVSSDVDLWDWDNDSIPKPNFVPTTRSRDITTESGFYLTARFNLADPLKLILGTRLDWYDYDNRGGDGDYKVTRNLTRYGGLVYDLDARHSLYASYSDIFQPQTAKDLDGDILKPIIGENYEIGVKGEYFNGALNASAAVFQIDQTNRARQLDDQSTCPSYPITACSEASGLVRSKGFELEIQGALTPSWQLAAGYTYANAKYVRDADPANKNRRFDTNTPLRQFKLSTLYRLPGALRDWRIGGSVYYQSDIYGKVTQYGSATPYRDARQKAYTLADLVLGYRVNKQFDVQLNINNLFDRTYYKGIGYDIGWGSVDTYGEPRNFMLTLRGEF